MCLRVTSPLLSLLLLSAPSSLLARNRNAGAMRCNCAISNSFLAKRTVITGFDLNIHSPPISRLAPSSEARVRVQCRRIRSRRRRRLKETLAARPQTEMKRKERKNGKARISGKGNIYSASCGNFSLSVFGIYFALSHYSVSPRELFSKPEMERKTLHFAQCV